MDTVTTSIASSSPDSRSPPYDVIFEILLQLPVMILLMMKCVSRFWNSIISSPQFIKAHLKLSTKKQDLRLLFNDSLGRPQFYTCPLSSILYQESHQRHVKLDFPCKSSSGEYKIEGSCNGLLCISVSRRDLFLWNPSIRELKKLPPPLASDNRFRPLCMHQNNDVLLQNASKLS
ncbi:PREDICTED: putative F-box protein At1g47790 [Nicotiana attenuata]|uniref:F-box protein n=1 Tax=Nicotiana attenuata TaxID=49451 RepID=A0A1J6IP77_NICAT|nr:PREDICTED: putative F-box protein At1g47790 [Nicotiana attenuata]OIT06973.1 putative f-box protein [Nicotiana attenuata]